eukprot:NODE_1787_length_757_cov_129.987288_g1389_i0.p1 GENE.NODE_1787_length_757_cov_129.987288_g1389_i0~~NODE_1787_length_757_cov_129.987288_g1389_i0.p1  ORF type:complete len:208 (+),score=47.14 NODE_1787_length_757_cov_129.987288_g1389_i0:33-656(+)
MGEVFDQISSGILDSMMNDEFVRTPSAPYAEDRIQSEKDEAHKPQEGPFEDEWEKIKKKFLEYIDIIESGGSAPKGQAAVLERMENYRVVHNLVNSRLSNSTLKPPVIIYRRLETLAEELTTKIAASVEVKEGENLEEKMKTVYKRYHTICNWVRIVFGSNMDLHFANRRNYVPVMKLLDNIFHANVFLNLEDQLPPYEQFCTSVIN